MRKSILAAAMLLAATLGAKAQTVNGTPLKDVNAKYMQLIVTQKLMSVKVIVLLDFGQKTKFFSNDKEKKIQDNEGNTIQFMGVIDAVNFMAENGYDLRHVYTKDIGNTNRTYYLLENTNYNPLKENENK